MRRFFLAVGFPEHIVDRAVADYERDFSQRYRPTAFTAVDQMLKALWAAGVHLGLITSNIRRNVTPALADAMAFFDERCLFFFDKYRIPKTKMWCLTEESVFSKLVLATVHTWEISPKTRAPHLKRAYISSGSLTGGISDDDKHYSRAKTVSGHSRETN